MYDPVDLRAAMAEFGKLAVDADQTLFDIVIEILKIHDDLDPSAGAGALQTQVMLAHIGLPPDRLAQLLRLVNYSPEGFYLVLRTYTFKYWDISDERNEFYEWLDAGAFDKMLLVTYVRKFIPDFGHNFFGGNHANTEARCD